jgi:hypothetical protein
MYLGLFATLIFMSTLFYNSKDMYGAVYWQMLFMWFLLVYYKELNIKNYMCYALLFHCVLVIIQHFWGVPWIRSVTTGQPVKMSLGVMFNVDASSSLVAVGMFALFRKKWIYLVPIPIIALLCIPAYGGMFAAVAGGLYYAYRMLTRKGFFIVAGVCLVLGGVQLLVDTPDLSVRPYLWKMSLTEHWDNLLWGVGSGKYSCYVPRMGEITAKYAHNEFLHYWIELGVLAPLAFIGWFFARMKQVRPDTVAAIIACSLTALTYFTLHEPIIACAVMTWAALACKEQRCVKKS